MEEGYFRSNNGIGRSFAEIAKYSALLGGVYSVAQDEVNLTGAAVAGAVYILADTVKETLREKADAYRARRLEDKLKE